MNVRRSALCGIVSAATVACATAQPKHVVEDEIPADELALEVDNHNWSDVLIYVLHDGFRERFVEVTATKSLTRTIPRRLIGSNGTVQFVVHRIGGRDESLPFIGGRTPVTQRDEYLSPQVSVRTGYTLSLTLESNLQRSTLAIW
jgi:hypothetical protein